MTKLQNLRQQSGISQSELSKKAGVNLRTLQYYEQGSKDINKAAAITVWSISKALGCSVDDILQLN